MAHLRRNDGQSGHKASFAPASDSEKRNSSKRVSTDSRDEAIRCPLDTMYVRKPYTVISRAGHIHPTVTELIPTILQEIVPLE